MAGQEDTDGKAAYGACAPQDRATILIDNRDFAAPRIIRER
ncbi:hypothetical protein [Actinoplanes hulinensis]|nr:hypothetical protein [Actinoplanes hulinensis]